MRKSKAGEIVHTVCKDVLNLREVIEETKLIENVCLKVDLEDPKKTSKIIEDTKDILCKLKDKVNNIDVYFQQNCHKMSKKSSVENNLTKNVNNEADVSTSTKNDKSSTSTCENDEDVMDCTEVLMEDPLKVQNEEVASSKVEDVDENADTVKPFIKCIDIKKLMRPDVKTFKYTTQESKSESVFIISDSEDENSLNKSNNVKKGVNAELKPKIVANNARGRRNSETKRVTRVPNISRRPNRERTKHKNISYVESSSDSESDSLEIDNSQTTTKKSIEDYDQRFFRSYVPLPRIACEKLKEFYLKPNEVERPIERLSKDTSSKDSPSQMMNEKSGSEVTEQHINNLIISIDSDQQSSSSEQSSKVANRNLKRNSSKSSKSQEEIKSSKKEMDKTDTVTIKDSDSDSDFETFSKKTVNTEKPAIKSRVCKKKARIIDSESDGETKKNNDDKNSGQDKDYKEEDATSKGKKSESSSSSSSSESEKESSDKEETENTSKKRKRITRLSDSSDEDLNKTRKTIRKVISHEYLTESTKRAEKDEQERKARIAERQKKYNAIFDDDQPIDASIDKLVLDFNEKTKKEIICVNQDLIGKLKPHQAKGIQFMWDACFESVERIKKGSGSGCILAHCMGLGKTLQVIALIHTLLANEEITKVQKVLVVCPVNTVLNWVAEFKKWLHDIEPEVEVIELATSKQNTTRQYQVEDWTKNGGVLIVGYDMFRNLTNTTNKRLRKSMRNVFEKGLVDPGPDLVICDEGHMLKNEKSNLSIAMNRIKTLRRIVLTGTPMQNNLKEYYCMVQFVKPNLLGTYKEYLNRFVNPITNGQYTDSTDLDIKIMRRRSHVLHKMLDGVIQRRDYSVLTPYLPPKYEYIIFLTLSEMQIKLYQHYLDNYARRPMELSKTRTAFLFTDFQELQRICTHPRVLLNKSIENQKKAILNDESEAESEGSLKNFIDDSEEEASDSSSSSSASSKSDKSDRSDSGSSRGKKKSKQQTQRLTRNAANVAGINIEEEVETAERDCLMSEQWFSQYCSGDEIDNIALSSKLHLLFDILQQCEVIGDKLLVFSQSLYSLDIIEYFLSKIDEATQNDASETVCNLKGSWSLGLDYFRLDGSSSCDNRSIWCNHFNNSENIRARLFLISTRAGGIGINLTGANRVIIFDVSWNPSHDIQSIYRVYRFGQTKPCYIYRFVTNGTMEMKVYERQVTKQAISKRVIDEQQIDRHYNQNDLAELYNFDPKPDNQPIPLVPKDVLLAELLQSRKDYIFKYHEHQTLLENKEDEELNEEERKAAWEEYENEKTARVNSVSGMGYIKNIPVQVIMGGIYGTVAKDNPTWNSARIQQVTPMIFQQLREQVEKGDMLLFNRVVNEIQIMQQQRMQNLYMQQQMHLLQQQYAFLNNAAGGRGPPPPGGGGPPPFQSNEIVELND